MYQYDVYEIMESEMNYICLECENEFKNDLKIAICQDCLEKEQVKFKKGIPSKYITVNLFLEKNLKPNIIKPSIKQK
jgi:DNA-directed RNA polymerase subunit RPC12/RpoP